MNIELPSRSFASPIVVAVTGLLALAAAFSVVFRVAGSELLSLSQLLVPVVFCAVGISFLIFLPVRQLVAWGRSLQPRAILLSVFLAGLTGVIWLFALPVAPAPAGVTELSVTVLDGKAELAKGREVWLRVERDGKDVPFTEFEQTGEWLDKAPFLVAANPSVPTSMKWRGSYSTNVRLIFVSHPWSGRARVTWNGAQKDLDLYSASGSDVVLDTGRVATTQSRLGFPLRGARQWLRAACDALVLGALTLALFAYLVKRSRRTRLPIQAPPSSDALRRLPVSGQCDRRAQHMHKKYGHSAATISFAVVSALAMSAGILFSWEWFVDLGGAKATLLLIGSAMGLAWLILAVLHRYRSRWNAIPPRDRLLWLAGSFFVGWLLTWMIPLDPVPGSPLSVEVASLASKSTSSKGTEVWVRLVVDGRAVELDEVHAGPTWTTAHGYLIAPMNSAPDRFRWRGHYATNAYLEFFKHDWSGQAVARWRGQEKRLDLYSAVGDDTKLLLGGQPISSRFLLFPSRTPLQYAVQAAQSVALGLLLLAGLAFATRWPSPLLRKQSVSDRTQWREVLLAASPLLLIGSGLLIVFLPAIMTTDSLDQWAQARTGNFSDAHPVLYAFYLWLVQRAYPSPTLAAWIQMAALAVASGWLAVEARRACNAPRWTSTAGGLLVAAYPLTSLTSITLWKDVPYAASVIALSAFVLGNLFFGRPDLRRWSHCLVLVLIAAACMALRHNGPPVAAAAFVILMFRAGTRRRVLVCLLLAAGLTWFVKGPLSDWVGTHRTSAAYMVYTHHLSAHLAAGQRPDSPADAAVLDAIDKGEADWRYRCSMANTTLFDEAYDIPTAVKHQDDLLRIWLGMALARPDVEIQHVLCASGMVWRYRTSAPLYLYSFGFQPGEGRTLQWIQPGLGGPAQASPFPETAWRIGRAVLKPEYVGAWRPAPFLLGLCLLTLVAWRRRQDARVLLIPVLALVHSAVLMVAIIAQDARYQLPVYVAFLALAPALALARRDRVKVPET